MKYNGTECYNTEHRTLYIYMKICTREIYGN
jgi:lipoate synthase